MILDYSLSISMRDRNLELIISLFYKTLTDIKYNAIINSTTEYKSFPI